jgi:hypothetical protein
MANKSGNRGKGQRDVNVLAYEIVQQATGQAPKPEPEPEKDPAAVSLGRLGGLKGGRARASVLSASKRKAIARKAAETRWHGR